MPYSRYLVIDSFPLAVCKFGRARYCQSFRSDGADYGKCITPASTDDREGLRDLTANHSGVTILGDKGYIGEALTQEMHSQGICLMALKRSNSKNDWPKTVRQLIFRLRRRVETVFSQLSEQLNAERVLAKSFQGLCTRLTNKILGYNLCLALNYLLNVDCEIGKIKQLIF